MIIFAYKLRNKSFLNKLTSTLRMFCNFSYPIQDLSFKISTSDKRRYRYHLRDIYSKKSCSVENPLTELSNVATLYYCEFLLVKCIKRQERQEIKKCWKMWKCWMKKLNEKRGWNQAWSDTKELFVRCWSELCVVKAWSGEGELCITFFSIVKSFNRKLED